MTARFCTILSPGRSRLTVKRSEFVALAAPARDRAHAERLLSSVALDQPSAAHVAYAFRTGRDRGVLVEGYSDAGEPHGTAGQPLLDLLRGDELDCSLVAVARNYGGIKLGTGGLARAYQQAGRAALELALTGPRVLCQEFLLTLPYSLYGAASAHLPARGWLIHAVEFGADVTMTIWTPRDEIEPLQAYLGGLGGGSISSAAGGQAYLVRRGESLEGDDCWTL